MHLLNERLAIYLQSIGGFVYRHSQFCAHPVPVTPNKRLIGTSETLTQSPEQHFRASIRPDIPLAWDTPDFEMPIHQCLSPGDAAMIVFNPSEDSDAPVQLPVGTWVKITKSGFFCEGDIGYIVGINHSTNSRTVVLVPRVPRTDIELVSWQTSQ